MLYSTDHLLEKNKDYVVAENAALVASSGSAFMRGLLVVPLEDGTDPALQRRNAFKLNSVGAQFRTQVCQLRTLQTQFDITHGREVKLDQRLAEASEHQCLMQRSDEVKHRVSQHLDHVERIVPKIYIHYSGQTLRSCRSLSRLPDIPYKTLKDVSYSSHVSQDCS